ncbi:pectinesterase inhibitor 10-like [Malania oleifera]|uniref:pectinesterase inhibitor 10-like n=1 Tax=Malania oleifera TaxID=397392 RepID=UPI0025ADE46D|nr:pectinesterase inhibitor 10-like [Malania oleifera]
MALKQMWETEKKNLSDLGSQTLLDCISQLQDAADDLQTSIESISSGLGDLTFVKKIEEILTFASSALTNDDTCRDAFDDIDSDTDEEVKIAVQNKIDEIKPYTSLSLIFIIRYANCTGCP